MTLILKPDLDMVTAYLYTEKEIPSRQIDKPDRNCYVSAHADGNESITEEWVSNRSVPGQDTSHNNYRPRT